MTLIRTLYLITGATGHIGGVLTNKLLAEKRDVRILCRKSNTEYFGGARVFTGDVLDRDSMRDFFNTEGYDRTVLAHCAGVVSISSHKNRNVYDVNVKGTENVLSLAMENHISRTVYVSSVDAFEKKPGTEPSCEPDKFCPELMKGPYAKAKAEASGTAMDYSAKGLDISVVCPSAVIGPGDRLRRNNSVISIGMIAEKKFPVTLPGGYNFVDVRDVADGITGCVEYGKKGECYLLTGEYISVKELIYTVYEYMGYTPPKISLPFFIAKIGAPFSELFSDITGKPSVYTPYSVRTLGTNGHFTSDKAKQTWGYSYRPASESIRDTLEYMGYIK